MDDEFDVTSDAGFIEQLEALTKAAKLMRTANTKAYFDSRYGG
jgi:hypothetical protein